MVIGLKNIKNKLYMLGILIIIISIIFFKIYYRENRNLIDINNSKLETIDVPLESRINDLKKYNYNNFFTVGWLQVQGTSIDFPIFTPTVKNLEESGDISPDFSYGWRHINYTLGENRMVLSAHNIINVSSKPIKNNNLLSDFESLMSFVYYDFAKDNQYIMYTNEDGSEELYIIYAIGFTNVDDEEYYSIKYDDKDNLDKYINSVRDNSIYNYNVDVNNNDDIISLITCTRFFGLNGDTLFRVDARKLRENEETYKYIVEKKERYNDVNKKLNEQGV